MCVHVHTFNISTSGNNDRTWGSVGLLNASCVGDGGPLGGTAVRTGVDETPVGAKGRVINVLPGKITNRSSTLLVSFSQGRTTARL